MSYAGWSEAVNRENLSIKLEESAATLSSKGLHFEAGLMGEAAAALRSVAGQEPVTNSPHYRHKKRGSIVREVARGFAQVAHHPIEEMTAVVIYQHVGDGKWWVRNAVEFDDGRFEPLALPVSPPARGEAEAFRNNLREAWAALAMIRDTVETLGPVGAMKASEHLDGPTFMHEADKIVRGIRALSPATSAGQTGDVQCDVGG